MRARRAVVLALLLPLLAATSSSAKAKPQVTDPKGDSLSTQAAHDITSVTFEAIRKGKKVKALQITMTLAAPPDRTPGMLYRVLGLQSKCGTFQFSSAATLALTEQNQVLMSCGGAGDTPGGGDSLVINVTPDVVGNSLVWLVSIKELPEEMQSGVMSELHAFVAPADPVTGILNAADFVPESAIDSATGTQTFGY